MNNEMINENDSSDKEEEKIYNYIGVIFENKNVPFDAPEDIAKQFYRKSTVYTYKTENYYKKGQIVNINSLSGTCRVLVVNPALMESEIKFPVDKIKLLEEAHYVKDLFCGRYSYNVNITFVKKWNCWRI